MKATKTEITLLSSFRLTDVSDVMRLQPLAWEIDGNEHTVESLKKTSAFRCAFTNFNLTDEFLQKLIDEKEK